MKFLKKFLKKIKAKFRMLFLTLGVWLFSVQMAMADTLTEKTGQEVSDAVVGTFSEYLLPLGGAVIFITVIICAIKIITTANNPNERANAIASLPYIIGGGLLLGGALLFSGFILGMGKSVQG